MEVLNWAQRAHYYYSNFNIRVAYYIKIEILHYGIRTSGFVHISFPSVSILILNMKYFHSQKSLKGARGYHLHAMQLSESHFTSNIFELNGNELEIKSNPFFNNGIRVIKQMYQVYDQLSNLDDYPHFFKKTEEKWEDVCLVL